MEILALLARLKQQGKTILIVEHRLELVLPFVDKMVVMANGQVAAEGSVAEVLKRKDPAIDALELNNDSSQSSIVTAFQDCRMTLALQFESTRSVVLPNRTSRIGL